MIGNITDADMAKAAPIFQRNLSVQATAQVLQVMQGSRS